MNRTRLILSRYRYKGKDYLAFEIPYREDFVTWAKGLGARWNSKRRAWTFLLTDQNLQDLHQVFDPWLEFDSTQLKVYHKNLYRKHEDWNNRTLPPDVLKAMNAMADQLSIANYASKSIETYIDSMTMCFKYLGVGLDGFNYDSVTRFRKEVLVKKNYANSSQRQFVTALRHFCKAARLPNMELEKIKLPKKEKKLPKVLSKEEILHIISCANNLKHRFMLSLLYSAGLRVGELINLKIADLDLDRRMINIRSGKGHKDRYIGMARATCLMASQYLQAYQPSHFVFNGQTDIKYSASSVRGVVNGCVRRAKISKKVTPHMFRHSFATHLLESGINIRVIQEALGHANLSTTQIYTFVSRDSLSGLANPFDDMVEQHLDRAIKQAEQDPFLGYHPVKKLGGNDGER